MAGGPSSNFLVVEVEFEVPFGFGFVVRVGKDFKSFLGAIVLKRVTNLVGRSQGEGASRSE